MYSTKAYQLTKEEYNYLLTVKKEQLYYNRETYSIITNEIEDTLVRLKGLYTNYIEELSPTLNYKCSKEGSIQPFRDFMELLGRGIV